MTPLGRISKAIRTRDIRINYLRLKIKELETGIRYEIEGIPKCQQCKWPEVNCQCEPGSAGRHLAMLRRLQKLMASDP